MCGIVAFCSRHEPALDPLVSGLKRMEYRGYDSAGVALIDGDDVYVQKAVGKIHELEAVIGEHPVPAKSTVGIAHTRWATHGAATKKNAHPHRDTSGKIWVTHNGIIENYEQLRARLEAEGATFESETDSEVIAKLIGIFYEGDLRDAVLQAAELLAGAFSICVICSDEPNRLVGMKVASPLVAGIGDDKVVIASDISAIIEHTKKVIYLEDGELIDVRGNDYEIVSLAGKPTVKTIATIDWDLETASKGGYDHYLLKEIMEQPRAIEDSIRGRLIENAADIHFGGLIDVEKRLHSIRNVVLVGVGTSYYAAKMGELYFNAVAGVPAVAVMSPEYRYTKNVIDKHTWLIAISQSGETADTIAAIEEAKHHGALVTGIVNVVGSTIARMTNGGVYNHIGPEISVASTKAFTSQTLLLLMHACSLGRRNDLDYAEAAELIKAIKRLPKTIQKVLDMREEIKAVAKGIADARNLLYIGRQYNYPIALEGALKIKEIAYVHAEGLSAGELKHGFIALVDETMPTIAIATNDSVTDKMLANIAEVRARGGRVVVFANKARSDNDTTVLPSVGNDMLQPLVNNVALQLLAYYVATQKDVDIDQPRNLAKSVTVE